ncbi:hypothetical protein C6P45_001299 [Maudiozyma exigua]|uniref:Zn(2)-C6 fungal-type domain-containing protein n=1 Tax=Maudiozyma exigua TaxID=34358 RepID=A0A9P6W0Z6_MAUEX|nr:hypothetical protein C6P45_001299 [Kazachstania exigua]
MENDDSKLSAIGTLEAQNATPKSRSGVQKVKKTKSKRHKPIRSCSFCRKRKLKCDQKKPICSSCKSRELSECIYTENSHSGNSSANSISNDSRSRQGSNMRRDSPGSATSGFAEYSTAPLRNLLSTMQFPPMEICNNSPDSSEKQSSPTTSHFSFYDDRLTTGVPNITHSIASSNAQNTTGNAESDVDEQIPNPFRNYYFIQCKDNGRTISYGPTSLRTFIMRNNWGFKDKYIQLWKKIKLERNNWKKKYMTNKNNELDLIELDLGNSVSILNDVLPCLPDYDSIKSYINDFFDEKNSILYDCNTFLDKRKIIYDLEFGFIQNRVGNIIQLKPTDKKNYYKIAVILMILVFTKFRQNIPVQILRLMTYLTGLVSPKTSYIEKSQFLLQQVFYISYFAQKGDETSLIGIMSQLTTSTMTLGLHLNIREIYKNREIMVGSCDSIENLWTWVLYFDFELSLRIGKPLDIALETFNDINYQDDNSLALFGDVMNDEFGLNRDNTRPEFGLIPKPLSSLLNNSPGTANQSGPKFPSSNKPRIRDFTKEKSFFGKMRRFLFLARPMLGEFYKKTGTPKLVEHGQVLLKFLEDELKPIKYATDPDLISELTFGDLRLILTILDIITIFYSVGFVLLNHRSLLLKNISIQTHLLTFAIFKNFVNHCFILDEKYFPEMIHPSYNNLTPYLTTCLGISLHPVLQSLGVFYAFFFLKATLFENGIFVSYDMTEVEWDMSSFNVPTDKSISLITTFNMYKKIFEDWISYDKQNKRGFQLKNLILRSYSGLILITLEKTYRIIVEKALEYRKKIETSLITESGCNKRENKKGVEMCDECHYSSNPPRLEVNSVDGSVGSPGPIGARQAYHSYLQYQVQLQEQNQILGLRKHIESLKEKDRNKLNLKKESMKNIGGGVNVDPNYNMASNNGYAAPADSKDTNDGHTVSSENGEPTIISSTGEKISASETEMAQKLVDDFWSSYNTGWEQLLNDSDSLFQNFEDELKNGMDRPFDLQ